ncbi:MAG TPA: phosphate ABC transporter permease family protein, partial [Hyphomicrobiaceae bacterium]|nr:phosphate ABC transporter permease family protein [Hyphomicrobiaceae bacterium]
MLSFAFAVLLVLTLIGFLVGHRRAIACVEGRTYQLHSRPAYHASFVAAWVGIPATLLLLVWLLVQGPVLDRLIMASLPDEVVAGKGVGELSLILSQIKSVADGTSFGQVDPAILEA